MGWLDKPLLKHYHNFKQKKQVNVLSVILINKLTLIN